jgi:HK97 gp10 family phage protein
MSWKVKSRLGKITAALRSESKDALFLAAGDVAVSAAANAPVDEGDLSESYQKDSALAVINELEIAVGSDEEHSVYQEYGTAYQDGTPHLVPAFIENKRNAADKLAAAARKAGK